ncbi:MAG: EAL domain-containing protein [Blautia sp.]|nr:EAL domain-containing protein [Blautia sp.]
MKDDQVLRAHTKKRRLLIVDDEIVNQELLGAILENDYELEFAQDGIEALSKLEESKVMFSLVLLDLIMSNLSGMEVLLEIRAKEKYQDIPVIVASSDYTQEIECLKRGASDFIQKPYPEPGVILARVHRAIELFENRKILQSTERDPLTGVYNREFFYSYAEQLDQSYPEVDMDAIVLDVKRFNTINERYGPAHGDNVLRQLGKKTEELIHSDGGIVCRREADIFQIYCPHRNDYKAFLDKITTGITSAPGIDSRIQLRMGVYSSVDKSLDIPRRFDRAKLAADTVRNSFTRSIGVYDDTLHKAELYHLQLIEAFPRAIDEKQFQVYFQPKYYILKETPILESAECLVRWHHPELGIISPGVFIPLFEENGLIQKLDYYVFREAARQIREWKDLLGYMVPLSVNVSRVDLGDPCIVENLLDILSEFGLGPTDMHLEVTETAYPMIRNSSSALSSVSVHKGS